VVAVRPDGEPLPLPRPRQRALLAALLLRAGRPVPSPRLIDEVWTEDPPDRPGPSLHTLVTRLRGYLSDARDDAGRLVTHPSGYALEIRANEVDSGRFESLRRQAAAMSPAAAVPLLEESLALWLGDPYPGVDFEAARLETIRLEDARLACRESLGRALLEAGRVVDALEVAESLVAEEPLREAARETLIRALYDVGRHPDALAHYEDYRRRLGDELGLEPSARLAALQLAVLRQDLPPAGRPDVVPDVGGAAGSVDIGGAQGVARSADGLSSLRVRFVDGPTGQIAFATAGTGPRLLHLPAWVTSIDVISSGRDPRSSLLERLTRHCTVVLYDRAGTGLSRDADPRPDLASGVAEARAVLDALGGPVYLLGMSQSGPLALRLAVEAPDLVDGLVLMGTYASASSTFTNQAMRESVVGLMRAHWGMGSKALADLYRPAASDLATDHLARVLRDSAEGKVAADYLDAVYDVEVADLLSQVRQPTLVVHYRGDRLMPFRGGHELATGLPNAELLALDGAWHLPDIADLDRIVAAVVRHMGVPDAATDASQPEPRV
jgi:DNA-binding SARP family transcriptional activator/pimeloyl-ACP methyl ester carboxylesterase